MFSNVIKYTSKWLYLDGKTVEYVWHIATILHKQLIMNMWSVICIFITYFYIVSELKPYKTRLDSHGRYIVPKKIVKYLCLCCIKLPKVFFFITLYVIIWSKIQILLSEIYVKWYAWSHKKITKSIPLVQISSKMYISNIFSIMFDEFCFNCILYRWTVYHKLRISIILLSCFHKS